MTEAELIATYPRLWHMAHDGAWPALRDHGLMSAKAIVDAYGVTGADRENLLRIRRPESVSLKGPGLPGAVLRDQKPMSDRALAGCLQGGMTPAEWYELLNTHSFFWLSRDRIWRLLRAQAYRSKPQTVLTIDTAGLVAAHRGRILLSPLNSGSTLFKAQPRGPATFAPIGAFPFNQRSATRPAKNNVVELLVEHAVPDLAEHVLAVHRVRDDQILGEIWRSQRAGADDHP